MKRACDRCGGEYEAKRPQSRFCSPRCRTAAAKARKAGPPAAQVVALPAEAAGEMEGATLAELEAVGRAGTALGKAALLMARSIDHAPAESGTSQAARFREWQSLLTKATAGTGTEKSALDKARDELAARRARRAGA